MSADREVTCPLCNKPNDCALAAGDRPVAACWCVRAGIPAAVLARVPVDKQAKACVCARCAAG